MATYGHALWHTSGPTEDMNAAFKRALEIAQQRDLQPQKLRAVWGLWARSILFGNYRESLLLAERFKEPAYLSNELANTQTADRMLALSHHFMGHQDEALKLLSKVIAGDSAPVRANHTNHAQVDGKTAVLALLMRILWLQGVSESALRIAKECAEDALALDHDLSICYGLAIGSIPIALWSNEIELAQRWNRHLAERTKNRGLRHWQVWSDGFAVILSGEGNIPPDASAMQLEVFATLTHKAITARVLSRLQTEGELWCGPELMRAEAASKATRGTAGSTEIGLGHACEVAPQQGTRDGLQLLEKTESEL